MSLRESKTWPITRLQLLFLRKPFVALLIHSLSNKFRGSDERPLATQSLDNLLHRSPERHENHHPCFSWTLISFFFAHFLTKILHHQGLQHVHFGMHTESAASLRLEFVHEGLEGWIRAKFGSFSVPAVCSF